MRKTAIIVFGAALLLIVVALLVNSGSFKTQDAGVSTSQQSKAVPIAADFPSDFPLIEGKVTASMKYDSVDEEEGAPVGVSHYVQVTTDMPIEKAMSFYKEKFSTIKSQNPLKDGSAMYSGFVNKHAVTIHFTKKGNGTFITIVLSSKK